MGGREDGRPTGRGLAGAMQEDDGGLQGPCVGVETHVAQRRRPVPRTQTKRPRFVGRASSGRDVDQGEGKEEEPEGTAGRAK